MARSARFYISRVSKGGTLDTDGFIRALKESAPLESRRFSWMAIDVVAESFAFNGREIPYLRGELAKYDPDGKIEVVNDRERVAELRLEPNMARARSRFVYLPTEQVIIHHHIWNEISANDFRNRLAELVMDHYSRFLVDCEIEPITDMSAFVIKLSELSEIDEIKARVRPPNPLFSPLWKSLDEYLKRRKVAQIRIREQASGQGKIDSKLPQYAEMIGTGSQLDEREPAEIGDAAVLMAADGYGVAEVSGRSEARDEARVVVKTGDVVVQLKLSLEISWDDLAKTAHRTLRRLEKQRGWKH